MCNSVITEPCITAPMTLSYNSLFTYASGIWYRCMVYGGVGIQNLIVVANTAACSSSL